jgi:hypothetical protein
VQAWPAWQGLNVGLGFKFSISRRSSGVGISERSGLRQGLGGRGQPLPFALLSSCRNASFLANDSAVFPPIQIFLANDSAVFFPVHQITEFRQTTVRVKVDDPSGATVKDGVYLHWRTRRRPPHPAMWWRRHAVGPWRHRPGIKKGRVVEFRVH